MENAERRRNAAYSCTKAGASNPIDPEIAFYREFSVPCCVSACPGHSNGLKLSSLPLQARSSPLARFLRLVARSRLPA